MEAVGSILLFLVILAYFLPILRGIVFALVLGGGLFYAAQNHWIPLDPALVGLMLPLLIVVVLIVHHGPKKKKKEKKD